MFRILYHPLSIVIVTILVVLLWASLILNGRQMSRSNQVIQSLQQEVNTSAEQTKQLEQRVEAAKTAQAKEEVIRNQLLMQKPGEYVVQLPDLPPSTPQPSPTPISLSPWQEWVQLVVK